MLEDDPLVVVVDEMSVDEENIPVTDALDVTDDEVDLERLVAAVMDEEMLVDVGLLEMAAVEEELLVVIGVEPPGVYVAGVTPRTDSRTAASVPGLEISP